MIPTAPATVLSFISVEESAPAIVGFIVVMAALTAIWLLLEIQGRFFQRLEKAQPAVEEAGMPEPEDLHGEVSPEMVAIVTAAVYATIDEPVRIVSIRPDSDSAWSSEGRRSIYSSHRIR